MKIIKFILKFILYVLAFVAVVLLLPLIAFILLYPLKYKISSNIENKDYETSIYASGFFRIIQYYKTTDGSYFRIFGIKKKKKVEGEEAQENSTSEEEQDEEESIVNTVFKKLQSGDSRSGILKKIQGTINQISYFKNHPDRNEIIKLTLEFLKKLGLKNKPKKLRITGIVGFETPDKTGMFLGALGIVSAYIPLDFDIAGDFEKQIIALNIKVTGRLVLWKVLYPIIRYALKEPIWKILKPLIFKNKNKEKGEEIYV